MIRSSRDFSKLPVPAAAVLLSLLSFSLLAAKSAETDSWAQARDDRDVSRVNEGELEFIAPVQDRPVLHADTRLNITARSLQTGWVDLQQCYRNLDAVDKTEIVYAYREIQALRVTRAENIKRFHAGPRGVELEGVVQGALVCLQARVRILRRLSDSTHTLRQGPYHRRFLDGYYPMRVSLDVTLKTDKLRFADISPDRGKGFKVWQGQNTVHYDAWFEGKLRTEIRFYSEVAISAADRADSRGMIADLDR